MSKKTIITMVALIVSATTFAQSPQKKLPPVVVIKLTDRQVLKLDSAINIIAQQIDSKSLTNYFSSAIQPIFTQIMYQLVADTAKINHINKKP